MVRDAKEPFKVLNVRTRTSASARATACSGRPRIFDQRDDGMVILLDDSPAPELHAAAHKAADLCPSQAITIEEIP